MTSTLGNIVVAVKFFYGEKQNQHTENKFAVNGQLVFGSRAMLETLSPASIVETLGEIEQGLLSVCDYPPGTDKQLSSKLISQGIKEARRQAKSFMSNEYGEDWGDTHYYRLGDLEFGQFEYPTEDRFEDW